MPETLNLPRVVEISCCHSRDRGVKKPTQVLCKPVPTMLFLQPRQVQSRVDPVPVRTAVVSSG